MSKKSPNPTLATLATVEITAEPFVEVTAMTKDGLRSQVHKLAPNHSIQCPDTKDSWLYHIKNTKVSAKAPLDTAWATEENYRSQIAEIERSHERAKTSMIGGTEVESEFKPKPWPSFGVKPQYLLWDNKTPHRLYPPCAVIRDSKGDIHHDSRGDVPTIALTSNGKESEETRDDDRTQTGETELPRIVFSHVDAE